MSVCLKKRNIWIWHFSRHLFSTAHLNQEVGKVAKCGAAQEGTIWWLTTWKFPKTIEIRRSLPRDSKASSVLSVRYGSLCSSPPIIYLTLVSMKRGASQPSGKGDSPLRWVRKRWICLVATLGVYRGAPAFSWPQRGKSNHKETPRLSLEVRRGTFERVRKEKRKEREVAEEMLVKLCIGSFYLTLVLLIQ